MSTRFAVGTPVVAGLALALALALGSGCRFQRVRDQIDEGILRGTIAGAVEGVDGRKPVIVALLREGAAGPAPVCFAVRHDASPFRFAVEPGRYALAAFEDLDEDLLRDDGEPGAAPDDPAPILVLPRGGKTGILLRFGPGRGERALAALHSSGPSAARARLPLKVGETARLDDPRFSAENGKLGYWMPLTFHDRLGGGIYSLGAGDDPGEVPVLFVHGAAGFPQQFQPLIAGLDRARHRPWIAHYPSGARLATIADDLATAITALHARHRFERIVVVAHSMGGLVMRATLQRLAPPPAGPRVTPFITISTPWGGHEAAAMGADRGAAVVPSWIDIAPRSGFIADTLGRPLPPRTAHHLLFGYAGGEAAFAGPGDGSVSFASMLDRRVQAAAASIRGFEADHVQILANADAIERVRAILDATRD
jgi:pimeloyl-ACP methyl ester carboxylesterase